MLLARRSRVADDAADRIRSLAEELGLRPGDRFPPERDLALRLGMGRTSIREGLRTLTMLGFVEVIPSKGVFLTADAAAPIARLVHDWLRTHRGSIRDLVELREALETQAAALAATRREPPDLDRMCRALDGMRDACQPDDSELFVRYDDAFHDAIAQAGRNPLLRKSLAAITTEVSTYKLTTARLGLRHRERAIADHEPVYAAIADGAAERARSAMRHHIVDTPNDFGLWRDPLTEVDPPPSPTERSPL